MGQAAKKAVFSLLFLFCLLFPVFAEPDAGEEPPLGGKVFFIEDFFIFDDVFSFAEYLLNEDDALFEEEAVEIEPQPGLANQELADAGSPEEDVVYEDEKVDIAVDSLPVGDAVIAETEEMALAKEENEDDEDDFDPDNFDMNAFFFEAPQLVIEVPTYEIRTINKIFPNLAPRQRNAATSSRGWRNSFLKNEEPSIVPNPELGIDLLGSVLKRKPSHLIEALVVVPYFGKDLDLLDVYNVVGRISKIKDAPVVINGNNYHAFTESSRIESAKKRKDIPDPMPAKLLPFSETIYLRLKEVNFGNLFLRGDITLSMYGITYNMTNFIAVRYFLIPIVGVERFSAVIYIEPVKEGILIYCMSGFYIPGFIADKVNLTPNINRRIEIFINWITEGLKSIEK